MKRKLFLALLFVPVFTFAQNDWERPQSKEQNNLHKQKAKKKAQPTLNKPNT